VFLEHCAGSPFRPLDREHRRIAADWLGTLHLRGREGLPGVHLRDRSLLTYHAHLGSTRRQLLDARAVLPLPDVDHALIDRVLAGLDGIEAAWAAIKEVCEPLPATLVHADAKPSNFMVRTRGSTLEFIPLDWAEAGWGVPVVDLPYVDGRVYWQTVGATWQHAVMARHRRMRTLGLLLRWLVAIDKVCMGMTDPSYTAQAMDQLRWFLLRVAPALRALDELAGDAARRPPGAG
jgi:aminoglycoside phosphotransferase (APT) family kinase protein